MRAACAAAVSFMIGSADFPRTGTGIWIRRDGSQACPAIGPHPAVQSFFAL